MSLWSGSFRTEAMSGAEARKSFYSVLGHMAAANWTVVVFESRNIDPMFRARLSQGKWSRELRLESCASSACEAQQKPE